MAQEGRHVFTSEEGELGARNSRLTRKATMKFEKKLAQLHLDSVTFSKIMDVAKVIIAQPGGVFLIGWLAIDGLERIGYFGPTLQSQAQSPGKTSTSTGTDPFKVLQDLFQAFPGVSSFAQSITELQGLASGQAGGSFDAGFLKGGLFAICMTQALGGGQGISTLATAGLAALK